MAPAGRRWPRRLAIGAAALLLSALAFAWGLRAALVLGPPHEARRTSARRSDALGWEIERAESVREPERAVAVALDLVGRHLRFGLHHPTSTWFDEGVRAAHCGEYANLYALVVERIASKSGVELEAWVVDSDARVLGAHLPLAGLRDHEWVLVLARGRRFYVDPTFADAGLGWDVSASVRGEIRLPR